jgi:hypothetical protein
LKNILGIFDFYRGPGACGAEGRIPSKAGDIALHKAEDFAQMLSLLGIVR